MLTAWHSYWPWSCRATPEILSVPDDRTRCRLSTESWLPARGSCQSAAWGQDLGRGVVTLQTEPPGAALRLALGTQGQQRRSHPPGRLGHAPAREWGMHGRGTARPPPQGGSGVSMRQEGRGPGSGGEAESRADRALQIRSPEHGEKLTGTLGTVEAACFSGFHPCPQKLLSHRLLHFAKMRTKGKTETEGRRQGPRSSPP